MKLPFLEGSKWPTSKEPSEKTVNPSYDTQIEDHLLDELLLALENHETSKLRETIVALVEHIRSQDIEEEHFENLKQLRSLTVNYILSTMVS